MKVNPRIQNLIITALFTASRVGSQGCAGSQSSSYPNCTAANTAFCEGEGGDIIFRCFYPYGHACPGNCMDNLDEQYRDAVCWESYPGAGDGQCAAECVSVTAKNGSTFYPLGCNQDRTSITASTPSSTTTSSSSRSTTIPLPVSTTTNSVLSPTRTANAASNRERVAWQGASAITGVVAFVEYVLNS